MRCARGGGVHHGIGIAIDQAGVRQTVVAVVGLTIVSLAGGGEGGSHCGRFAVDRKKTRTQRCRCGVVVGGELIAVEAAVARQNAQARAACHRSCFDRDAST